MDVIVEGKITAEEGMDEVLQTVIDLKSVANPILRVNCLDERIQGKIAFGQGGFILGGKIEETGEVGFPAIRRLLLVQNGNYAILDPGRQQFPDINQTLWIEAARLIQLMPNLPETMEVLLGGKSAAAKPIPVEVPAAVTTKKAPQRTNIQEIDSRARRFDSSTAAYRYTVAFIWTIFVLLLGVVLAAHFDTVRSVTHLDTIRSQVQTWIK